MAVAGSSSGRRAEDLLEPFLETLQLHQPIPIPADTLLGAITHFLSTLPNQDVARLMLALARSVSLWNGDVSADRIREAIAVAVESKLDKLQARHSESWFHSRRVSRDMGRWLHCIAGALKNDGESTNPLQATHIRLGLLRGMQAASIDWKTVKVSLEEAVVVTLAQHMEASIVQRDTLDLLCEAVICLEAERVSVLDPLVLLPLVQDALFAALDGNSESEQQITILSNAIARLFDITAADSSSPSDVFVPMADFVTAFLDRAKRIEAEQGAREGKGKMTEKDMKKHNNCLAAFVPPASSLVDILLTRIHPAPAMDTLDNLPMRIVETLCAFSSICETDQDRPEGFDRVLYGSLDLLASADDSMVVRQLFVSLSEDHIPPSRVAFILQCGELLVRTLDRVAVVDVLLPLADRALREQERPQNIDSAHAFMVAVIKSAGDTHVRPFPQESFALETLPYYSEFLLKHSKRDWISSETFTTSYLAILELAAKVDDRMSDDLTERLILIDAMDSPSSHSLLATSIAASQFVRRRRLRLHLDEVGSRILTLPMGENRLDLAAKLFTVISQNLSDDTRGMGMTWWWEWKEALLGGSSGKAQARAKL